MTYIPSTTKDFANYRPASAPALPRIDATRVDTLAPATPAPRRNLLKRLFDAMQDSRQRQVDREIARYLASIGGKLTDSAEREIMRHLAGDTRRF